MSYEILRVREMVFSREDMNIDAYTYTYTNTHGVKVNEETIHLEEKGVYGKF